MSHGIFRTFDVFRTVILWSRSLSELGEWVAGSSIMVGKREHSGERKR